MERIKVVARYNNGDVVKGFTQNFFPNKDRFHLFPEDQPGGNGVEVYIENLKAVFVVRDFAGDSHYQEQKRFNGGEQPSGRKIEVVFRDDEVLVGTTLTYNRNGSGFFVFPADPKSNNIRVFVLPSATKTIRQL
jgi:hypothetical protein